ncbi:glycosyltransferase family 4 protein [Synechococcus sp. HB1133]|uniref:glycosyltransferase family 4 protein n=1 Tax=unclassified Synechococcus TaxID=2626047 RepID=UPI00140A26E7|nr:MULTISPECIES: glycosyltransferase family 4 protein [unclassified Synechococcus]MCB4421444.1 glycosyltransferase family 4 protein [Synechococcus sp. HB1133]MCB4431205.1 glycosyltransferase family 4 protein [Synechococcus sp. HBA1120]NHI80386.1 glycosyltransferase family 1 protein [Synechococcus sp. HB1133]
MKIVLINHGTAGEWGGGDSVQIKETAKRLLERGHDVSIQNSDEPIVKGADVAHIFNCRVYESLKKQFQVCRDEGIPTVISPIWIPLGRAIWGSRGTLAVLEMGITNGEESIASQLKELKERKLSVYSNGKLFKYESTEKAGLEWLKDVSNIINQADGVLPNSWLELKSLQLDLNYTGNNYDVAYYGVDSSLFLNSDAEEFRNMSGIRTPFIMQAGRIEPGKNQAMLCWALRKTDVKIVLVGSTKHWPAYAELCRKISGNKLTIIDHLPQKLLGSAYKAANVHCLTSWMDTCGLVSLEAALCGTPIVGSTFGHELEYLKNDAWLADPGDEQSIRKSIENAWNSGKHNENIYRLKNRILGKYNWEQMTTASEEMYKKVI